MRNQINMFNTLSVDEELTEEFYNFFSRYNLIPLFTDDKRVDDMNVSDLDMRAVVNPDGAYARTLIKFSDYLQMAGDNITFDEAMFEILYESNSFRGLINNLKKVMGFIDHEIEAGHAYNAWNIVFYKDDIY